MGDIDFGKPDYPTDENELVRPESAVQIIRDLVMQVIMQWMEDESIQRIEEYRRIWTNSSYFQYPNKISLIGLGPLTNFALAVKMYPEIKDKVKDIYLMGGNHKGILRHKTTLISKLRHCSPFFFFIQSQDKEI